MPVKEQFINPRSGLVNKVWIDYFLRIATEQLKSTQTGPTLNKSDDELLSRNNHTDTQPISSIDGLSSTLATKQNSLVSGSNIKTVNGTSILGTGDLVVSASTEQIDDRVAALLIGSGAVLSYNDVMNTLTITVSNNSYFPQGW